MLVDGVDVRDLDSGELRSLIGMVPQDPFLFSATIEENIGLGIGLDLGAEEPGAEDEDPDEVVLEAARVAQLHMAIEGFPKGWGTLLGERGVNLSGGQKQRTTLARAVARDPRILVLDDALSAVDTHTEARILDDLAHVMEGRTSFIISHRVSAVMNADLIPRTGWRPNGRARPPHRADGPRWDLRPVATPANARTGYRVDDRGVK